MKKIISYGIKFILIRIIGLFSKVKDNRVLFLSEVRKELGGNLLMMDNIISDKKYEKIYYLKESRQSSASFKDKIYLYKLIGTSEYILLDDFSPNISFMNPKKNQKIVQLWHGPGAYKTFGLSRNDKKPNFLKRYLTHRNYTKAIVTSESIRWCYAEGFGMNEKDVIACGYPRTDIFFDKEYIKNKRNELYKKYSEFKNKKIIMFAPTYRGVSLLKSYYDYDVLDVDKIYKELHKDYIFIIKWHPGLKDSKEREEFNKKIVKYKDFYYDFTSYRDINDLLLITDVLVTDYSSVIFDYLLVNKPIVYFTYDQEKYKDSRGLYYPFDDYIYGEIAKDSNELIESIKKNNMMNDKRKKFNEKFMSSCDGTSTKKTYDMIFK